MSEELFERLLVEMMDTLRIYERDNIPIRRSGPCATGVTVHFADTKAIRIRSLIQEMKASRKTVSA